MWTVEQCINAGLFFAHELDVPTNVEVRLLPRESVTNGMVKFSRLDPVELSLNPKPIRRVETDVVQIQQLGHPKIAETLMYAYSSILNILAIILDG